MKTLSNNRPILVRFESEILPTFVGLYFLATVFENATGLVVYSLSNGKVLDMKEVGPEIVYGRIRTFKKV